MESARREIGDIGQGLTGQVKLGIVSTAAQFLLPPAARDLLKEAPGVTVRTTVALGDSKKSSIGPNGGGGEYLSSIEVRFTHTTLETSS